jgi:hypothetical protein
MAQFIIIPEHTVSLSDLANSIPGGKFKKLYFQCALTEIKLNGNDREAHFSIIVYAAKRNIFQKWKPGIKVDCTPVAGGKTAKFNLADYTEPIGFANNELYDFNFTGKQKKAKGTDKQQLKQDDLMRKIKRILKDKKKAAQSKLSFVAKISKNPHVTYTVTLSDGTTAGANPSPPADPS